MEPRLLLPRPVRRLPADLAAIVVLTLLTDLFVLAPVLNETPVRIVLGLVFVLLAPGYVFTAALFPEAGERPAATPESRAVADEGSEGIDGIERLALSLGTSVAIVPLVGLILNFTPFGIRLVPIVVSLSVFTLGGGAVAAIRRWGVPRDERFSVPYRDWYDATRSELLEPETRTDAVLNLVLVVSLVLAISSVGYAVIVPTQSEQFTELYLLTENESGGLVADGYPQNVSVGEAESLVVGIGNHEHEAVDYTLVVELQRVEMMNNTSNSVTNASAADSSVEVRVLDSAEVARFSPRVGANQTWLRPHSVTPTFEGEQIRLVYLLYEGDVPTNPTTENAYREVHLWLNVSETSAQQSLRSQ